MKRLYYIEKNEYKDKTILKIRIEKIYNNGQTLFAEYLKHWESNGHSGGYTEYSITVDKNPGFFSKSFYGNYKKQIKTSIQMCEWEIETHKKSKETPTTTYLKR